MLLGVVCAFSVELRQQGGAQTCHRLLHGGYAPLRLGVEVRRRQSGRRGDAGQGAVLAVRLQQPGAAAEAHSAGVPPVTQGGVAHDPAAVEGGGARRAALDQEVAALRRRLARAERELAAEATSPEGEA